MYDLKTDLMGDFQMHNIKTVLTACAVLQQLGWNLPFETVVESLAAVKQNTGLRGRWEIVQRNPFIIFDVAHNPDGMEYLKGNLDNLKQLNNSTATLHVVCGFVSDKDVRTAFSYFPKDASYYFTQANVPRAMPYEELYSIGKEMLLNGSAYETVKDALAAARSNAGTNDIILVTGSFFIVGEAIAVMEDRIMS
jgi:dihydrofolate synthase/folylpolyglutamate synthase